MSLANLSKGTLIFGVLAALYLIVVLTKLDEPYNVQRWIFLAALVSIAGVFSTWRGKISMELMTFFKYVHLLLAVIYLWGARSGPWAKRDEMAEGILSVDGGTGYGTVALVLGVLLLLLAFMRLAGRSKVLPGLGVEQLTVILGIAAWMNILAFIVGWLATFEAGTGWGAVVAYFPASLIPQLGLITLAGAEPATGIKELESTKRQAFSAVALIGGVGVALFPFLAYITSGNLSLTAMDGRSEGTLSGPRFGYMLLIFGVVVAVGALMRMRPRGLAEPGPNALLGHVLCAAGLVAFLVPFATFISIAQSSIDINTGIGVWLGRLAGLVLIGVAMVENRMRGAVAA